jgi:hypothetical protein
MTIPELIAMCERRLIHLASVKASAVALGDLAQVDSLDAQIAQTEETKNLLMTLV